MDEKKPTKKYATSALAQRRIAAGLTQVDAAAKLGMKHKQNLSAVETGLKMANPKMMKAMSIAYGCSSLAILEASVATFENGLTLRKHRARQEKLRRAMTETPA